MAKDVQRLSSLQLLIMRVLWERGRATIQEILGVVSQRKKLAQPTVATVLRRLEEKGCVAHERDGRAFVYYPLITSESVRKAVIGDVVRDLFQGSPSELVHHLVAEQELADADLERIKALIASAERTRKEGGRDG